MTESTYDVPVWTLATEDTVAPLVMTEGALTSARLNELRTVLAAPVDAPLATLEAHPLPKTADLSGGMSLESASPLASHISQLAFKGIGGEFRTHLELAKLSIDLNQPVAVLQAVEHAQLDPTRLFEGFTQALKRRAQRVVELHHRIATVLGRLSSLEIDRAHGVRDFVFKSSEVDTLLRTSRRVRALSESIELSGPQPDVAIEIACKADGSLVVLPAQSAFAQS